jgi:hypothetical protein
VPTNRREQLSDEAVPSPVRKAYAAAAATDAHELVRRAHVVRRKHYAKGRQNDVERTVRKGQSFRICLLEVES